MAKAKQFPAYDRAEIKKTINSYSTELYDSINKSLYASYRDIYIRAHETGVVDIDAYIKAYENDTTYSVSYKHFIRAMCIYRDACKNMGNLEGLTIINKLIGDKKLFSKMVFCGDGSYRNNRIWSDVRGSMLHFDIRSRGIDKPETDDPKAIRKYIDLIFRSYPVVFIQIFVNGTDDEIDNYIDWMYDRDKYPYY